mgnify:CR=1 FL=1
MLPLHMAAATVDGLCKDPGAGGLSRAPGSGKQIGMGCLTALDLIFQSSGNVGL